MKVRAIRNGYYNNKQVYEGEEFDLLDIHFKDKKGQKQVMKAESQFSELWMETIDGSKPSKLADKKDAGDIPGYKKSGKAPNQPSSKAVKPEQVAE